MVAQKELKEGVAIVNIRLVSAGTRQIVKIIL